MFFLLIKPWVMVRWIYCEIDRLGVRVIKQKGKCRAYKAICAYVFVCVCNYLIKKCGADYCASDFLVCDAKQTKGDF